MLSLILGIVLGALIYYKLIKPAGYWSERHITYEPWALPIIGNMKEFVFRKKHFLQVTEELYKKYPNDRYVGYLLFTTPSLLIRDLDLIKQIGIKEFDHFHDHSKTTTKSIDPILSKSLVHLWGEKWKQMRATLSPAFTSSKMRNMYHLMVECSENFVSHFSGKGQVDVEMKDVLSKFATNVIASTAFGIQVDSVKNPNDKFNIMAKRLTELSGTKALKIFLAQTAMNIAKLFKIRILDEDMADFFQSIIVNNIYKRESEGIVRPDLIHLLMEARKSKLKHDNTEDEKVEGFATVEESHVGKNFNQIELTDDQIVAQCLLFFFAGFETVSNVSSLMAYELAINFDIQKKLLEEIDSVRQQYVTKVPYETLASMKYLDQVVCETLRKWPPGFLTDRYCRKEFTILPTNSREKTFVVEKGVTVIIPIMALHRDPQYFPNPEKFDPERFNDKNKLKIIPGSYLPFGIGPRNCIGSRFALLEIKTLFFNLLSEFEIIPNEKTEIPLKINPKSVNIGPENGFQLSLKPRLIR